MYIYLTILLIKINKNRIKIKELIATTTDGHTLEMCYLFASVYPELEPSLRNIEYRFEGVVRNGYMFDVTDDFS